MAMELRIHSQVQSPVFRQGMVLRHWQRTTTAGSSRGLQSSLELQETFCNPRNLQSEDSSSRFNLQAYIHTYENIVRARAAKGRARYTISEIVTCAF